MEIYKRAPVTVNPVLLHPAERRIALDGSWQFRLDPEDKGLSERWHTLGDLPDTIEVPGTWQGQGFGGDGVELPWNNGLPVRTFRATYTGTGWYARRFQIPHDWQGLRVWLNFGGVHPSVDVWLNGIRLGEHHGAPFVPFGLEITDVLSWNEDNVLVVRVHERSREMGMAYNYQGNWSGLYRGVELTATGPSFLDQLRIHPDVDHARLDIKAWTADPDSSQGPLTLRISTQPVSGASPAVTTEAPVNAGRTNLSMSVPSPELWSPDAPNLYRVDAQLAQGNRVLDSCSERIGFVKLSTEGKHFLINNEPYFIRGTGDFVSSPETGSPDTDRGRWRKKLSALREYGYNQVRCQSFAYSPEYLDVADEVGLLIQSEMGILGPWGQQTMWHVQQWPQPTPDNREALKWQWDRVVMRDVNHPSAIIYCMSNELGANTLYPRIAWQAYWDTKAIRPSAFVIWTDGGWNENLPGDFVNDEASDAVYRSDRGGEGVEGRTEKPVIQHEFRWWVSYPDVRIRHKYSGAIRPFAAEIAYDAAARHGLAHVLPRAAATSQRLQWVEAKGKMEACRRDTPRLAGISHFMAMDLNMSPQGIFDEFYERKYADSSLWLESNGDTVILSGLGFDDRVLSAGDTLQCALSVSDFSHPPLQRPQLDWKLVSDDEVLAAGQIAYSHQPYLACPAGQVEVTIPDVASPRTAKLQAVLREGGRVFTNHWDLWLLPKETHLPSSVYLYGEPQHTWLKGVTGLPVVEEPASNRGARAVLTERIDEKMVQFARQGGRVILAASEGLLRPFVQRRMTDQERYFFGFTANDPPFEHGHTGTIIEDHPMLGDLPHDDFADLQFFRMIGDSAPLDLAPLGLNSGEPTIRVMHSYPACRPLAYLVECSLGRGSLILCALKLDQSLAEGRYLLGQTCKYAVGEESQPMLEISDDSISSLIKGTAIP